MNPDKSWDTSDVLVFMKGVANYNGKKQNFPNSAFSYRDFERWCALWMIWFWCDLYFIQERQHCRCDLPDLADAFIHKPSTLQVFAGGAIEVPRSWSLPQQMEYPWPWYANYDWSHSDARKKLMRGFLGSHYPNATGHKDGKDEAMPLEGDFLPFSLRSKSDGHCQFVCRER